MNRDDIIEMWKRSGDVEIRGVPISKIEAFAALVTKPWADQLEVERKKFQELQDIAVTGMQHARIAERERILDICKEGLWDAEGIRYHLDKQERENT